MDGSKVKLEFWMGERFGWENPGPLKMEFPIEEGESLLGLLNKLGEQIKNFDATIFNPRTQSLSSEAIIVLNDSVKTLPEMSETKLKHGDRILFLPLLVGG